jgi:hypothetical protein
VIGDGSHVDAGGRPPHLPTERSQPSKPNRQARWLRHELRITWFASRLPLGTWLSGAGAKPSAEGATPVKGWAGFPTAQALQSFQAKGRQVSPLGKTTAGDGIGMVEAAEKPPEPDRTALVIGLSHQGHRSQSQALTT